MNYPLPWLASGSIHFSAADNAIIIGTFILWGISALLAFANLVLIILIFRARRSSLFAETNVVLLIAAIILAVLLINGTLARLNPTALIGSIFAIPALVIGQFIYLVRRFRRERRQKQPAAKDVEKS